MVFGTFSPSETLQDTRQGNSPLVCCLYILRQHRPDGWSSNLFMGNETEGVGNLTVILGSPDRQSPDEQCTAMSLNKPF